MSGRDSRLSLLEQFATALDDHDLDRLVECFHPDYRSIQPVHPNRDFTGRENVARNWSWVFEQFEDFEAELLDVALGDGSAWTEWAWSGTDLSGTRIEVRGVMIFSIENGMFTQGRLYLEPVSQFAD